jgi:hypothetical protein
MIYSFAIEDHCSGDTHRESCLIRSMRWIVRGKHQHSSRFYQQINETHAPGESRPSWCRWVQSMKSQLHKDTRRDREIFRAVRGFPTLTMVSRKIRQESLPIFFNKVIVLNAACNRTSTPARNRRGTTDRTKNSTSIETPRGRNVIDNLSRLVTHFMYYEAPLVIIVTPRQPYLDSMPFSATTVESSFACTLHGEHWSVCFAAMDVAFRPQTFSVPLALDYFPPAVWPILTDPLDDRRYGIAFVCTWVQRIACYMRAYDGFEVGTGFSGDAIARLHKICQAIQYACMKGATYEHKQWVLSSNSELLDSVM